MTKPIKIALIVVAVLLLLVFGALFAAAALFDPNDYRGRISEAVKEQTGRTLSLGDIKLSVFPWLKVRVSDVSFSNAPGFGRAPMAQAKEAAVGVQLLPLLLHRQVQVSTVRLQGLKLDLAKNADGQTNWADLTRAADADKPTEPPKNDAGKAFKIESLDIAGVALVDSAIEYRDAQANQHYRVEKLNLETGTLRPGAPTDIQASLLATDVIKKLSADLKVSATVLADLVAQKASVDRLRLEVKAKGEGLDAAVKLAGDIAANLQTQAVDVKNLAAEFQAAQGDLKADGTLAAQIVANLRTQQVDVSGLKLDVQGAQKDLKGSGTLAGKLRADLGQKVVGIEGLKLDFKASTPTVQASGQLAAQVKAGLESKLYELSGLSLSADASGSAVPGGKQSVKLSGQAQYDGAKGSARLSDAKLGVAGLSIATAVQAEGLGGDAARFSGPISIAPFNPRALLKTLGMDEIKTTDPKALGNASLSARFNGGMRALRIDDLNLKLDDSSVVGTLAIKDFATQAIEFALKLDRIDADRYLAPPVQPTATPAAAQSTQQLNAVELPVEALEKLNASGSLDAGELKIKGAILKNVQLRIDGPKGSPKLVKLDASTYGGQIATSTRLVPGTQPSYAINTTVNAIQLAPMLQNFWGKDIVSGLGTIKLDLNSKGKTVGDVRRTLNGDIALNFQDGAVKGFNLAQIVRQGEALLKGTTLTESEPKQTDFTSISFAAQVVNGVLKSKDLNALSPLFRLAGNGEINLVDETLNYLVSPTVVASAKGQGGKGLDQLAGLTIPIRLTGSLYAPKYKLDLQNALKQKAGDELRGKLADKVLGGQSGEQLSDTELKQKANEKLNKEIGRGLEKLLGGKKKKAEEPVPAAPPSSEPAANAAPAEPAPVEAAPAP